MLGYFDFTKDSYKKQSPTTDNRINKTISIVTTILVFLVALGAFAVSYSALQDLASENGIAGWLSFIWPLLIDFSLIVFSLSVVSAYLQSESTWKQWSLVGIYTLATIGFNVAHAPNNPQAQIVATIAPASLFFSFELLMGQLRSSVNKYGMTQGIADLSHRYQTLIDKVNQKSKELEHMNAELESTARPGVKLRANDTGFILGDLDALERANSKRIVKVAKRREQVSLLAQDGMSQAEIANELGVSISTIKRDTKALNGRVS